MAAQLDVAALHRSSPSNDHELEIHTTRGVPRQVSTGWRDWTSRMIAWLTRLAKPEILNY
jgi:hypothetical protein